MRTDKLLRLAGVGLVAAVALLALTSCNPILSQPTAVRSGGVSRSGHLVYTSEVSGWLEVQVRSSADSTVSVLAFGRDETRDHDGMSPADWCYFTTAASPAWTAGTSLGYQRLGRIGPGTDLKVQFSAPTAGTTFDARVVDDAGNPVGDLTHQVPSGFDDVSGPICGA